MIVEESQNLHLSFLDEVESQLNQTYMHRGSSCGATKSSPAIGGQYQDIRVSRLDYVQMYSVATNAKRTNMEMKDDPDSNLKPNYVNLPNN